MALASKPTADCYALVTKTVAAHSGHLSSDAARQIGAYLGRCVYLIDAYSDITCDIRCGAYNPFAYLAGSTKHSIWSRASEVLHNYLDSEKQQLEDVLKHVPELVRTKWSRIMRSFTHRMFKNSSGRLNMCCVMPCGDCQVGCDGEDCGNCLGCICVCMCCAACSRGC